jgi:hypothetical protein
MRISALVFAAALLTAAPVFAQTDPAPPAPAGGGAQEPQTQTTPPTETTAPETTAQNDQNRRICRTVQRTESRLRTRRERICGTQAEWDIMSREASDTVNGLGRTPPPSN